VKFRYLTFDCYGTLVDWKKGIVQSLSIAGVATGLAPHALLDAYLAEEKEQERSYQKYSHVLAKSVIAMSKNVGVKIGRKAALEFASSVPNWPAFPDSRSFLKKIGEVGYARYILSNVDTGMLEETIRRNRFEVDGFVTAEEVGGYKPGRRHWLGFMEKTGAKKDETLHVAQSVFHDILPAQELGIASAWVNRYREALPVGAHPLYIVDGLKSLGEVLERGAA
jgi:2-haloalkanoic acid dehalogenase type II